MKKVSKCKLTPTHSGRDQARGRGRFVPILAGLFGIHQKPNKRQSQSETNTSGLYRWDQASRQSRRSRHIPGISGGFIWCFAVNRFKAVSRRFDVLPISQYQPAHKSPLNRLKSPHTGQRINKPFPANTGTSRNITD